MRKFTVLANDEKTFDHAALGQMWKPDDKRFYMEFEGDDIEIRDEYHSMHELYQHRMALTIALFNLINYVDTQNELTVIKSKLHFDGTMFDGGYFIVMALTPNGQISYHYKLKHWDKFRIPEVEKAPKWDGHTSLDALERLIKI